MSDMDLKPNSHKYKEEQQNQENRVQKVVKGSTKTKPKSKVHKFTDTFLSEDVDSVKEYVVSNIMIPAFKKLVSDIVRDGIDMLLYGESGRRKDGCGNSDYVSYSRYYDRKDDRHSEPRARTRFDYNDIIFETRGDAERVRSQMMDIIDTYGFVTVADLYDLSDLDAPYTSNKYGWRSLRSAESVRGRDGYLLKLPKALPID